MWVRAAIWGAVLVAVVVAGCGGGTGTGGVGPVAKTPKAARGNRRAKPGTGPVRPPRRVRSAPRCRPGQLVVSHTELGNGALSHYYTGFDLTNPSYRACSIAGFPKVFELGRDGRPVGTAASHGTPSPERRARTVTIAKDGEARFRASWEEDIYAAGQCRPQTITRFRVVLPGSHLAQVVPYPVFGRCTSPVGQESFSVSKIEPPVERRFRPEVPYVREALPREDLPRCRDADLLAWTGPDHAAGIGLGSVFARIDVMNLSDHACAISGVPRLVAVDLRGRPVGSPAQEGEMTVGRERIRVARIGPHRSGAFGYATGGYYNYGRGGCEHRHAAGFLVTLPGASRAQYVPAPLPRCLKIRGQLSVGPVE